jgi:hypothetical protein
MDSASGEHTQACTMLHITRVGPNRMTGYTPYPRYAVYPVPYLKFLTVYGPYLQVVHPRLGFNSLQKRFLLFLVQFFYLVAF